MGDESRTSHSVILALTGLPLPSFAAHNPMKSNPRLRWCLARRPATTGRYG